MKCPKCGAEVIQGAQRCNNCGVQFATGKRCPYCQSVIPTNAATCPKCGKLQPDARGSALFDQPRERGSFRWWYILIGIGIFIVGAVSGIMVGMGLTTGEKNISPPNVSSDLPASKAEKLPDEVKKEESAVDPPKEVVSDTDDLLSQLETTEYSYQSMGFRYWFLKVKNNSPLNLRVKVDVEFYDEAGNLVAVESSEQEAFEAGHEVLLYEMPDENYTSIKYSITPSKETYYDCVVSDLSYEASETDQKVILDVTNNGDKAAEFVMAKVLFFKEGQVSGFSQTYFTDDQFELKPGSSMKKELDCYDGYDSYQVFFTGRRD